ncbi:MAG: TraR/DksA family transcriptional regulator [Pseudomonadota bacterium]
MSDELDINIEEMKQRLLDRKAVIEAALESDDEVSGPVELDQTRQGRLSRMDAMQMQAMQLATQERCRNELKRIAAALHRIDIGEYGYCVVTGEPIGKARLMADPAVPTCIEAVRDKK